MSFKKNKRHVYCVEWDCDASTSEDEEKTPSTSLAGIVINKNISILDTPSCLMSKGPKVQFNERTISESEDEEPF